MGVQRIVAEDLSGAPADRHEHERDHPEYVCRNLSMGFALGCVRSFAVPANLTGLPRPSGPRPAVADSAPVEPAPLACTPSVASTKKKHLGARAVGDSVLESERVLQQPSAVPHIPGLACSGGGSSLPVSTPRWSRTMVLIARLSRRFRPPCVSPFAEGSVRDRPATILPAPASGPAG